MYCNSYEELKSAVSKMTIDSEEKLMIMVGDKSEASVYEMMWYLKEKNISFFGGIYSGLLVGNKNYREGYVVHKVKPVFSALVLPHMMRFKHDPAEFAGCTAIVVVDGLSGSMKVLTDTLFDKLGTNVTYVGGGAGFYDMKHRKCVFSNDGLFEDALFVCIVKNETRLAVEHGWEKLEGPFFVKESIDNVLVKLDIDSAFEVYRHVIEEEERITLFKDDFFIYAKDHPFGIVQKDGSIVVRDPISTTETGEIICVANIPEGSDVYVLKGDAETLLASSKKITSVSPVSPGKKYIPFLFNCISRAMFLEDRFSEELSNIQKNLDYLLEGALSIGEIATGHDGKIIIHNKSTVMAYMEE
ncbi:MAG: FIST domain-containing protein [Clostridiales bacterium]|nr:FIST domain-containing protein [Clostridiales bacterium]